MTSDGTLSLNDLILEGHATSRSSTNRGNDQQQSFNCYSPTFTKVAMTVVMFDIDGTLVRTGGAGKEAIEASLAEEFGVTLSTQDIPYSGRTDLAISRDLLESHGIDATDANIEKLAEGYLNRLKHYLQRSKGQSCPGIDDLVWELHEREDVTLGLLTGNVQRGAKLKLSRYDLWQFFEFGGFGDGCYDRDDVAHAARKAIHDNVGDIDSSKIWVIGDTPLDIRCARAIGAKVVGVATGSYRLDALEECNPDLAFEDLSDPSKLMDALTS